MANNYQSILKKSESLYNAKKVSENTVGNSTNLIFEVEISQTPFILRVSEYSEKKIAHVEFELNWMNYLSVGLDNIVKPVKSVNDNLYEVIESADGKRYILCMFEKAKGNIVDCNNPVEFNDDLFINLGALMGNMHKLTKEYKGNVVKPEFEWDRIAEFWGSKSHVEVFDEEIHTLGEKFKKEILILPKSKETYGLTHSDIHTHNFFVDNGHIKLFDFDDCRFNWYAAEIAGTFRYIIQAAKPFRVNDKERTEFAEYYLSAYLKGYTQTNNISEYWIDKFDLFMRLSMTEAYKFIQNNWKDEQVNPHQEYLYWFNYRLKNNMPFVYIDYKKIVSGITSIRTV